MAYLSTEGVIPLSATLTLDQSADQRVSITNRIQGAINEIGRWQATNFGWQILAFPTAQMAIVNVPYQAGAVQHQFVMNTITGAWSRYTGLRANVFEVFQDRLYFGGNKGAVVQAECGDSDNGELIVGIMRGAFTDCNRAGQVKQWRGVRPLIAARSAPLVYLGLDTDFGDSPSSETLATLDVVGGASGALAKWSTAQWGVSTWSADERPVSAWAALSGVGYYGSIRMRFSRQEAPAASTSQKDVARIFAFQLPYHLGEFS